MGSGHGHAFRITTFGESHGGGLGVVIEGCPPDIALDLHRVQWELDRRRPGQSKLTTRRQEPDEVEVLSGLFEGRTLGSPIAMLVRNRDADPSAYLEMRDKYRPSHADYTTEARYGIRAWAGGGRASARETVARVAAGAVARQVLEHLASSTGRAAPTILAWVERVGDIRGAIDSHSVTLEQVEANPVRCPDAWAAEEMAARIKEIQRDGDTIGGVVRAVARNLPPGLGDPVFDKLEADLAKAMLSIPAAKGFESGSGYQGTLLTGSAHNDAFIPGPGGTVRTSTNHSGGIQGGISNGMPIDLTVAFKPVATIFKDQDTVDRDGQATTIKPRGRHDPCVVPRAVPIVEAMLALVLADHWLRWRGQVGERQS